MLDGLPVELVGEIADQLPDIVMVAQLRLVSHAVKDGVDAGSRQWRTAQEVRDAGGKADILKSREKTLEFAAARGRMSMLRRMHPSLNEVIPTLLVTASVWGHVNVVRELREDYGLTVDDARASNNEALRLACVYGNVEVVRELRLGFKLTAEDARVMDNCPLRGACHYGHVGVVRELRLGYGLTAYDARVRDNEALCLACWHGHNEVVRELHEGYGLTVDETR